MEDTRGVDMEREACCVWVCGVFMIRACMGGWAEFWRQALNARRQT